MKKIWILLGIGLIVVGIFFLMKKDQKNVISNQSSVIGNLEIRKEKSVLLKFAVMADVHNDIDDLKKVLEIEKNNLVVIAGDLTINGTRSELMNVLVQLGESGVKYVAVPGNHDLYKNQWSGVFGKDYQSVKMGNVKLILINNGNWKGLGEEQKKWIENEAKECQLITCVAVMHMPLWNNFSKHVMGEYLPTTALEAKWLKEMFLKNNVKTGYSGHLHYNSEYEIDGWKTVLVGAISKDRNTQTPRFTEVTVYDDGTIENNVKLLINN